MSDPHRHLRLLPKIPPHPIDPDISRGRPVPPPLPPMRLSRFARLGLIGLRLFLGLIVAMAIVTFLHSA
jgi:hypothetical protein